MGQQYSAVENMVTPSFWQNKVVLITGHTGFKGGWLSLWLSHLGAKVHGYSLPPPTQPNFFETIQLEKLLQLHTISDIRDREKLRQSMQSTKPEIVFHLAAQPLVRYSYANPVETYEVNMIGTINLLEAVRATPSVRTVVVVTSDKCYENQEWGWGYRENEPMGGFDPYSSSKGCVELICSAYRNSYFSGNQHQIHNVSLATARAGNVIGGGDWAQDRLVPDFFRALCAGQPLQIRSPNSIRPWQHVLEPLAGYISLAEQQVVNGPRWAEAWNFGPNEDDAKTVAWIADQLACRYPQASIVKSSEAKLHEASLLKLDSSKAKSRLKWKPRWQVEDALEKTAYWYSAQMQGCDMQRLSLDQIHDYESVKEVF